MAKAISDEELQLKKKARRRLVGAIALVLVVVVFLPMFLDSEPKPLSQDIAITIPPIPDSETPAPQAQDPANAPTALPGLPPPPQPGNPEPAPAAEETQVPPPAATGPAAREDTASPESRAPARAEPVRQAARPPSKAKVAAAAPGDGYVVQLGAFSNAANAQALQRKLQENKFKAYTELIKSSGGTRTRVRVGPYPSKDAADKARAQLRARKLVIGDATVVRQGD
jgi:DedD protein